MLFKIFLNDKYIHLDEIDTVIEEIINDEDFESSEIEIETFDSIEDLKDPQEYEDSFIYYFR